MSSLVPHLLNDCPPPLGEEPSHPERPEDLGETQISGMQQVVVTAIRATDVTLGLRRIPAGFHVVVKTGGAEYQTSNKPVHVGQAVVEWNEPILLPCEPCSIVRVSVYASFELGPMLYHGEVLRTFKISVGELLERSEKSRPIIFQPKQDEVVSPCTSLFMTVKQQRSDENTAAVFCPHTTPTSDDMDALVLKTDAGHRLLARYRRTQNNGDLDQSIKHFECALDLCPMEHPCHPAALFNLATAKFVSHQANGTYLDLDIPISLFEDALEFRPAGHADRPITQLHLAIALLSYFAKRGLKTDADAAGELLREVLHVCHANSHIYRVALVAIKTSAQLRPARSTNTNNVGRRRRWLAMPMLPLLLNQLPVLAQRCLGKDDPHALDEVISLHYNALRYCNPMDSQAQLLCNLGVMLRTRFQRQGNIQDLNEAVTRLRQSLALRPSGHPDRFKPLNSLAIALSTRFKHQGISQDLNEAIVLHREALALTPVGHTDRSVSLSNLALSLSVLFNHQGNDQDSDDAISLHREALALRPVGHPDRSVTLNGIGGELSTRFEHRGNIQDLNEAIPFQREVLALHPVGHPNRAMALCNLARGLHNRFNHRGNDPDLEETIMLYSEALTLYLVGHPLRSMPLNQLAVMLSIRFEHQGNDQDLDDAITLHREALALCPVGHTDRSKSLCSLANGLCARLGHRGNDQDLDEAIALYREALTLRPIHHLDRSVTLHGIANGLSTRFEHRGNVQDLNEAIAHCREVLAFLPARHARQSMSLHSLASKLSTRFKHRGNDEDLDEAIMLHRDALALCPVGHPDRSMSLNYLATVLATRFEHRGNGEDLHESRENLHCALTLLTQHDPCQLTAQKSLANVYLLFHQSGLDGAGKNIDNLNAAIHHLKAAANVVSGGLLRRLQASLHWVRHANDNSHYTELEAYATSMQLLDAYMSSTASVSSRHNTMKTFPSTLAVDAASCALRSGDVCRAVELLEQGRTIIWTQMTRLRMPLDNLQERGDHAVTLMKRFRNLSSLLDTPPANHPEGIPKIDGEAEASRYRRVVEQWNRAVEEIREIKGFSRFQLPPLFSDLQDAACDGPIIVLVASKSSCDAIIIPHKQPPTSIQLPTNFVKLATLMISLQLAVKKDAGPQRTQPELLKALRELWNDVVRPVVGNLGGFARPGSRIWWCPTSLFNFLPLHAAGEYRRNGRSLSQLYISSYTPSLTALIRARRSHDRSLSVSFSAIGQNHPAGHSFALDCVEPELELVRSLLPPPPTVFFTKITSVDATKSRALRALQDNTWLHFACHGTQNYTEPFKSAFLMRDQPLSLLDITETDLSWHEFAFLSACETAVGDAKTPDEVVHLAAGLQFAGVKSVVGTLWNVNDATVQRLVEAFYKNFCGDGKMNSKRAARALHRAVQSLACDKDIPLDQRIVFMHIGI